MRVTTITPSPQVALLFTSSGSVADTRSARLLPIGLEKRCSCVSALEERHKPPASRKRARCNREKSPWARATFASTSSIKLDTNSLPLAQRVRRKAQGSRHQRVHSLRTTPEAQGRPRTRWTNQSAEQLRKTEPPRIFGGVAGH